MTCSLGQSGYKTKACKPQPHTIPKPTSKQIRHTHNRMGDIGPAKANKHTNKQSETKKDQTTVTKKPTKNYNSEDQT